MQTVCERRYETSGRGEVDIIRAPRKSAAWLAGLAGAIVAGILVASVGFASTRDAAAPPVELTAEQDHQRILKLLHISSLRAGPESDPTSPHAANSDESKANPYPRLPDPLVCRDGKRVTTAKTWWASRRPQILADFDREVYGRVPERTPKSDLGSNEHNAGSHQRRARDYEEARGTR